MSMKVLLDLKSILTGKKQAGDAAGTVNSSPPVVQFTLSTTGMTHLTACSRLSMECSPWSHVMTLTWSTAAVVIVF